MLPVHRNITDPVYWSHVPQFKLLCWLILRRQFWTFLGELIKVMPALVVGVKHSDQAQKGYQILTVMRADISCSELSIFGSSPPYLKWCQDHVMFGLLLAFKSSTFLASILQCACSCLLCLQCHFSPASFNKAQLRLKTLILKSFHRQMYSNCPLAVARKQVIEDLM